MLLEMGIIGAGIPAGWVLRHHEGAKAVVGRVLTWAVWALLFLLGLSLGSDDVLLEQISRLGARAVIISSLSVLGCLISARLIGRRLKLDMPESSKSGGRQGQSSEDGVAA